MIRLIIGFFVAGTDDPLGPVDQDPNEIRRTACKLVAPDSVCSPPAPRPAEPPSGGSGGAGGPIIELLLWLLFIGLVVALVYLVVRVAMSAQSTPRRRRTKAVEAEDADDVEQLEPVVVDRSREPSEWRREAEEHRRAGRFRDAVRCRYHALVGDLARRGLIDEIPGRTTGEERTQMATVAPQEAPAFSAVAELFDEVWFGDARVADADVVEMEALEQRVLANAGARRP